MTMRKVRAIRYVTPLREGGSLPAIIEADDLGSYVLKFRGAGQGPKALIAELIGGEIARLLGLLVPEIVFVELDARLGRNEPDSEIRELITSSVGLNIALDYLPGSITFDPGADRWAVASAELASKIVWLDAFLTNVDRTARNANMLVWHKRLWMIDHGASLYFHHNWKDHRLQAKNNFAAIKDHVLLFASTPELIEAADAAANSILSMEELTFITNLIPETWLTWAAQSPVKEDPRAAYAEYLRTRLEYSQDFVREAIDARARLV